MPISQWIVPVADIEEGLALFRDTMAMPLRFRDGARYAALDAGGSRLGLVAGSERIVEQPAPAFRVTGLDTAIRRHQRAGYRLSSTSEGPHEARAVMKGPSGLRFVLFAPQLRSGNPA